MCSRIGKQFQCADKTNLVLFTNHFCKVQPMRWLLFLWLCSSHCFFCLFAGKDDEEGEFCHYWFFAFIHHCLRTLYYYNVVEVGSKKFWHVSTNFTTLSEVKGQDHTYNSMCWGFPVLDCGTEINKMLYPEEADTYSFFTISLQNSLFISWIFL